MFKLPLQLQGLQLLPCTVGLPKYPNTHLKQDKQTDFNLNHFCFSPVPCIEHWKIGNRMQHIAALLVILRCLLACVGWASVFPPADTPFTSVSTVTMSAHAIHLSWANVQAGQRKTAKRHIYILILIQSKIRWAWLSYVMKNDLTCSIWRGMERHGRSCWLRLHRNPLYSAHSGPQWCQTGSSGG